ncbi:MAG: glycosyltransferase family 9 protein [Candidatus Kaiserbacteria bacterium]|nr:glycosyltransferase family 9 protein [Candidatus Kaiserbacteria bacterium]
MRINFDYLNIFKEPVLFGALMVRRALRRKMTTTSDAILIVNTCLIGEFAASAQALHEFIRAHEGATSIDLLVSPPLKSLAQHVQGVRTVYIAKSVFARTAEHSHDTKQQFGSYKKIIVMRISPDAYRMLGAIETVEMRTSLPHLVTYGIHLAWNLLLGETPRSWREVSFDMLNKAPRNIPFDELFSIPSTEYARIRALPALQTVQKKVIVHTGSSWSMNHWDADNWVELIKKLHALGDFRFIFVGAQKDKADYRYISSRLSLQTYSLIGQIDLLDLTLVLRTSDYFIGVDSGPRNLAHLVGLPSITLLGPGPHMFTPHNPHDIVLDRSEGRGLYQRFFYQREQNRFIERITPQNVYGAFKDRLYRA